MSFSVPEDRSRLGWWSFGILLGVVLVSVIYAFIGTFVFGVFFYYVTRPIYTRMKRRVRPPSLAAVLSLVLLALPVVLLLAYTVAIAIQEVTRLSAAYDLRSLEPFFGPYVDISTILQRPDELLREGGFDAIRDVVTAAAAYVGVLAIGALHLFVMIALAFYLLRDDHRLSRWIRHRFADDAGVLVAYLDAVDRSYHQIFFGNILNAIFTGIIGAVTYNLIAAFAPPAIAIPYPTVLGLLAGAASLIPIVGMKLVYVPATAYLAGVALASGQPRLLTVAAVFGIVSFVIVDTIPDLLLRPYVSGRSLHVGMVMFAYIFGPLLFGWYGIFLGPMVLVLIVHFARVVLPELVMGVPIRPVAVDPSYLTAPAAESPAADEADP